MVAKFNVGSQNLLREENHETHYSQSLDCYLNACWNFYDPTAMGIRVCSEVNHLNAELNPICHLLILLGDLTFMGRYVVSICNKMQRYTVYLYLETVLHVSVGTSTHHQERILLYLQHLVFVIPLLLSAAIVEELEQV
jgi:hypothetical protein